MDTVTPLAERLSHHEGREGHEDRTEKEESNLKNGFPSCSSCASWCCRFLLWLRLCRDRPGRRLRRGHDIAAFLTGSKILVAEEALICLGDGILSVIVHNEALFVQESVAFAAVPVKAIDFACASLSL